MNWQRQNIQIESQDDKQDCENLLDLAFGPERHARTINMLRRNIAPMPCSVVYRQNDACIGMVRFYKLMTALGANAVMLGPIAIHPQFQNQGLGKFLIEYGCEILDNLGHKMIFLVGFANYYEQFGFQFVDNLYYINGPITPKHLLVRCKDTPLIQQHAGQLDFVQ